MTDQAHPSHGVSSVRSFPTSRAASVLIVFLVITGALLFTEHRATFLAC
jgi:hypothetical protein